MVFGMNNTEFIYFTIIAVSLLTGSLLGALLCMIITARQNKSLEKEIDKFRDLYFEEMDKWKNKYNQDDYEAY
jgi:formiminotetrahydrofolate cyclodeaminase